MTNPPNIRRSSETIKIMVPLTPADHEEIHAEMIKHNQELARLEMKIDDHKGAIKAAQKEVDTLYARIRASIGVIDIGEKQVDMECTKITDYSAGAVRYISRDSGELVKERLLTDSEKQMSMDFDGDNEDAGEEVTCIGAETSPDAHPDDAPADPPATGADRALAAVKTALADEAATPPPADPTSITLPGSLAAPREPLPFKPLKGKAPQKRSTAHA